MPKDKKVTWPTTLPVPVNQGLYDTETMTLNPGFLICPGWTNGS